MKLLTKLIIYVLITSVVILSGSDLYAQDQKEDVVYLINGVIIRGKILDITKDTISIRQKGGYFLKYNVNEVLRFVSDRSLDEIYKESAETEIKKPVTTYKSTNKETEQSYKKRESKSDGMISTAVLGQHQRQNEKNPFSGLWKSKIGSLVKIDGNQGVLIYTPSEPWKKFIHKITIKNIRQQDDSWIAEEWIISDENNIWILAKWQLVDDKIKRDMTFEGKKLETFFIKTSREVFPISSDAKDYFNRGVANDSSGRINEAISGYSKALEIDPGFAEAYNNRGSAYELIGQYNQAISDYSKFIDLNPTDAVAYSNRGIAYFFNKDFDNAWKDVKKAQALGCKIHPEFLKMLREALGRER